MERFYSGQVVKTMIGSKDLGIIITECKKPKGYWVVALRNRHEDRIKIININEKKLQAYANHCWNCYRELNSDFNHTCAMCGWIKCPDCGKCKKEECTTNGLEIVMKEDEEIKLEPWEVALF